MTELYYLMRRFEHWWWILGYVLAVAGLEYLSFRWLTTCCAASIAL